jgi:predicted ABC-type transport system involved in lysophospholipase L1 biosynthesis ATPase subunit
MRAKTPNTNDGKLDALLAHQRHEHAPGALDGGAQGFITVARRLAAE